MPFFFLLFLLLVPAAADHHHRRILHQPLFPLDSLPPSQPPSSSPPSPPSSPKYPFTYSSSSPPASDNSPFFPTYPSPPPPPPPSPGSFASFPANISSLILPHSTSLPSSRKLIPLAVTASVISAILLSFTAFFIYRRYRSSGCRRGLSGDADDLAKTPSLPDYGVEQRNAEAATGSGGGRKQRNTTPSTNSSEFLYLGTIVNSRGVEERRNADRGGANGGLDPRKLDSPELQPLPPLARQGYRQNGDVGSTAGETEEEFYSPRGSIGAGSGSRRVFAAAVADLGESGRRKSESSLSSSSSSTSCSPARSHSISLSPPVSLSPRRSQAKSPEHAAEQQQQVHYAIPLPDESKTPLLLSSQSTSPERDPPKRKFSRSSSASSDQNHRPHSPSLSPLSWSPNRGLERNPDVSLRMWNISDSNVQSPRSSPSPGRDSSIRAEKSRRSFPFFRSPGRVVVAIVTSPRTSSASDESQSERFSLPTISSSPVRASRSPSHSSSLSPEKTLGVSSDEHPPMPEAVAAESPPTQTLPAMAVPPPPPPPPPPPMLTVPQKLQESPIQLTPSDQPISRPPPLTPPSRPFMLQNTVKVSPMELPPSSHEAETVTDETQKPKLKPLHWDKVRASSDREMVWDHLRSSSFQLNEEMIETLFVVNTPSSKLNDMTPRSVLPHPNQENRVLDPKKSQNIAILLRAVNVTIEEVCEALLEGNAEMLGTELLENLQKMAPTKEEERKLKDYKDDSPFKLGPAEKFLKAMLDVPFAFKRVDTMLYIANFESEVDYLKKSFTTLEGACEELRNSRMFLKLLEAVLKTGNRMNVGTNRGDAHAFKLDTLLKLVDVKGADGKTTLLHFVVQEIIRSEGARLSGKTQKDPSNLNQSEDVKCRRLGLQVVAGLSSELTNVKKAAAMDSDVLSGDVNKLSIGIRKIVDIVQLIESSNIPDGSSTKFSESMSRFTKMAEEEIIRIQAQESVAMSLVKEITEYFHGNSAKEEAHPFRIFMVVRDFLAILDRVCKEVGSINERTIVSSAHRFPVPINPLLPVPVNPMLPQVLPTFPGKKRYDSSDDDSSSP
ncbi:hypothetical protein SAY87_004337 [Trapa incisa]|uniref:Formin-like protein n=1 Tax=Trapa incisa TaxID=236973 RepID=A0AAN7JNP2_9MYRT|nr:hypothetical protein SAY87_004337 [Trapa incisa]